MKTLTSLVLFAVFGAVVVSAQTTLTDNDATQLISRVKLTPVSQLDPALPAVAFETWLRLQVGTEASINWAVRTASGRGYPWVEADILDQGRPGLVIMVACGTPEGAIATKPKFHSLELVRKGESAEWPHLRDLPAALRRARDGAR